VKSGSDDGHYHEHVSESQCCMITAAVAVAGAVPVAVVEVAGAEAPHC
jgi:hypothetical protein